MINELHSIKAKVYSPVKMNTTLNAGIAKPEAGLRERVDEVEKQVEDLQLFDEEVSKALKQQDENTQTIVNKIVEIDEKDETQDALIENLQNQIVELEAENENLKNQIPTGQAEGENITLNDSSDMEFKELRIGGNSWQETREGYNQLKTTKVYEDITYFGVTCKTNDDGTITLNGTATGNTEFHLKLIDETNELQANKNYILKRKLISGTASKIQIAYTIDSVVGVFDTESKDLGTSENARSIYHIRVYVSANTTYSNAKIGVMLCEGMAEKPFELYGAMPSPEFPSKIKNVTGSANITVCNGNLLNPEKVVADSNNSYTYLENGFIRFATINERLIIKPINIKENTAYSFNLICKSNVTQEHNVNFSAEYTDGSVEVLSRNRRTDTNEFSCVFTTDSLKTLVCIRTSWTEGYVVYLKIEGSMILEGEYTADNMPEYQPHQSQQITFPLAEGQRMYKDSYLADDGVHHKRGVKVFDGTENWQYNSTYKVFWGGLNRLGFDYLPTQKGYITKVSNYFSYYPQNGNNNTLDDGIYENSDTNSLSQILIHLASITSLSDFKAYLAEQYANGTPVIVEYELAEEIIEPYTEEQQLVYNEINKAHSYKNVTHIFSTDETSPIVDVTYRKDLETMFNNINNAILGGN